MKTVVTARKTIFSLLVAVGVSMVVSMQVVNAQVQKPITPPITSIVTPTPTNKPPTLTPPGSLTSCTTGYVGAPFKKTFSSYDPEGEEPVVTESRPTANGLPANFTFSCRLETVEKPGFTRTYKICNVTGTPTAEQVGQTYYLALLSRDSQLNKTSNFYCFNFIPFPGKTSMPTRTPTPTATPTPTVVPDNQIPQ